MTFPLCQIKKSGSDILEHMTTEGKLLVWGIILVIIGGGWWYVSRDATEEGGATSKIVATSTTAQPFIIDNVPITLINGVSEIESAPGSASKIITKYFGNEVKADFNGDGVQDSAFLVTQTTGGSGTFYYLVTSLGGEAKLLGDRIAPQTTEWRNGMIVVNFAERKEGEPMTTAPSIGVSRSFKVEKNALVEIKNDATESASGVVTGTVSLSPTCPVERTPPDPNCASKAFVTDVIAFEKLSQEMVARGTTSSKGVYTLKLPPGDYTIHASTTGMYPRCTDKFVSIQRSGTITLDISCDSGIR
jgi:hypothetical protein